MQDQCDLNVNKSNRILDDKYYPLSPQNPIYLFCLLQFLRWSLTQYAYFFIQLQEQNLYIS